MGNQYSGRGLDEDKVDKLRREDAYINEKALADAKTKRVVKQIEAEIVVLNNAPWLIGGLFALAVIGLWFADQKVAAATLLTSAVSGISGFVYGAKDKKDNKNP